MSDADTLVEIAKLAASRHDQRRQYEWKVSFGFWALLVGALIEGRTIFPNASAYPVATIVIGCLVVLMYAFMWLRRVWIANYNDKTLSDCFREQATLKLIDSKYVIVIPPKMLTSESCKFWFGFLLDWAMQFHLFVTSALVFLVCAKILTS